MSDVHPQGTDRPSLRLRHRQHQRPHRKTCTLVTNAAQQTTAIVTVGVLKSTFELGSLPVGLVMHGFDHGLMAIVGRMGLRELHRTRRMVRSALCHGHPDTCPQPQGHQAQQEAKDKSAHDQIISQG